MLLIYFKSDHVTFKGNIFQLPGFRGYRRNAPSVLQVLQPLILCNKSRLNHWRRFCDGQHDNNIKLEFYVLNILRFVWRYKYIVIFSISFFSNYFRLRLFIYSRCSFYFYISFVSWVSSLSNHELLRKKIKIIPIFIFMNELSITY